ncbi:unnamed protein product [Paramecium pentaurelia]|uniref:Uncharacterized protein n=1 Tax=Paramecium pentaurelia TaxID=43138 RepID=A0A8S1VVA8_9CILI|nr:unnamed protein product [Paramecium pentaurelia]
MNHLERILHEQGKTVKIQGQELDDIKHKYQELQNKLFKEEEKNKILQQNIDKLSLIENELRRQIQFVEAQRDNLLDQLKSLHEYNFSMFNLQHNQSFNKMRTVQQLKLTQDELQKSQQQLLKLQSENAEFRGKVKELMIKNQSLNEQIQILPQEIEKLKQKYIKLLSERDTQIQLLDYKIDELRKQKQQEKEEKCENIEYEESEITEDKNSEQDVIQQSLIDNIEIIKTMKLSDQEKQNTILRLSEQVTMLQIENSKQQLLLTNQQISQLYPQDIQLQIRRIQQLRTYIPQFTTKFAIIQMKLQEINQLRQDNLNLREEYQKQNKQLKINQQKYLNKKQKLENLQKQFSNVLQENWKLKEKLIDILKNEQLVEQFLQNLTNELNFDEYPFESLDQLLKNYNLIRNKLMNQSEQKHMSLI